MDGTRYSVCKQDENENYTDDDMPTNSDSSTSDEDEFFSAISSISIVKKKDSIQHRALPTKIIAQGEKSFPINEAGSRRVLPIEDSVITTPLPTNETGQTKDLPKIRYPIIKRSFKPSTGSKDWNEENQIPLPTKCSSNQVSKIIVTIGNEKINENTASDTDDDFSFDEVFGDIENDNDIRRFRQKKERLKKEDEYFLTDADRIANSFLAPSIPPSPSENKRRHSIDLERVSLFSRRRAENDNRLNTATKIDGSSENANESSIASSINIIKYKGREYNKRMKRRPTSGGFVRNNTWKNVGLPHKPARVLFEDFDRTFADDVSLLS